MDKKIYDAVFEYGKKNIISFHMPGHKGKNFFTENIFKFDITEIPGMDNLYNADGIIKESQERAARLYGAKRSFFLTGGGTAGILAAVLTCVSSGDKILVARNCHRSVTSGVMLSGAEPLYVYPEIAEGGIAGGITPEKVSAALEGSKGVKAVVITSPTYEGIVSDIKKISEITKSAGAYLITDCAHGAHFPFSDSFPDYPDESDIVISSLHKTLPVFGQCAIMHVNNERLMEKAALALAMVQTSSPSYLFLSSIDKFLSDFENKLYPFEEYVNNLLGLRSALAGLKRIKLLGGGLLGSFSVFDMDISRLVFLLGEGSPQRFACLLHERHAIDIEAYYLQHAIAISSAADSAEDLEALLNAVTEIDEEWEGGGNAGKRFPESPRPEIIYTPQKAWNMPKEYVDIRESAGRVSAEIILTYPPGIAVVAPGEAIHEETARFLIYCMENNLQVHGVRNSRVCVLKK